MIFKTFQSFDDINYNTTKNYHERGKYVNMIPIIMKVLRLLLFYFYMLVALSFNDYYKKEFSLFMLKVLFYLPMLITMFFIDLFDYKISMHRKWVRLKCV